MIHLDIRIHKSYINPLRLIALLQKSYIYVPNGKILCNLKYTNKILGSQNQKEGKQIHKTRKVKCKKEAV